MLRNPQWKRALPLNQKTSKGKKKLAIYHYSVQVIGRSSGRSAVACAAYRAGERLYCRETGTEKDYRQKDRVDEKMILAPPDAPKWVYSREDLWNEIHAKENRKNSQFCREINVAIPRELSSEAQVGLVREFVQSEYVDKGMVADVCCHNLKGKNPHAHIMLSTRFLTPEGFGKKERAWNDKKVLLQQREAWATFCNRRLEREGVRERIDHRSLKEQGLDREPSIHLGSKPHPERVARLESIQERNRTLQALKKELRGVLTHLDVALRRERALDQQRKEQAQIARDRVADQKRQQEAAFENQLEKTLKRAERKARIDDFLRSAGVWTSSEATKQKENVERELSNATWWKTVKKQEYEQLESEKGLFTIFKNKRLAAKMKLVDAEYTKWEQTEKQLQGRVAQLDKAYEILRERERPAREARELQERKERARKRAQYEREKEQRAALDPRYKEVVKRFGGTLGRRLELETQLAAAPNDQTRDKMLAEWQRTNQKNLGRGRGR